MRIFFVDTQKSFVGKGFPQCLRVFLTEFLQQIFGYIQWRQTERKLTSTTRLFDHEKRDFRDI